jgi:hypothetical protein
MVPLLKRHAAALLLILPLIALPSATLAQNTPGQPAPIPQPGQMGSPFPKDHVWNHVGLEIAGGYTPVIGKGQGYFSQGFNVTGGVVDHLSAHWSVLAEVEIFGLHGSETLAGSGSQGSATTFTNTLLGLDGAASYDFLPRARTSPYVIGGGGYYRIGPTKSTVAGNSSLTAVDSASAAGFNAGAGIRHRLFPDRRMELFAEGRYHYIASGSTAFGQLSLLPVTAGLRW